MSSPVHIEIRLSLSSPTISLSEPQSEKSLTLSTAARIITTPREDCDITLSVHRTCLDNGGHALLRGFFCMEEVNSDGRRISLGAGKRLDCYLRSSSEDMREHSWEHFHTIPAIGRGELVLNHELSLKRIFRYDYDQTRGSIKAGDAFRINFNENLMPELGCDWWTYGSLDSDLKEKKFNDGWTEDLERSDYTPEVRKKMQDEGWVFSEEGTISFTGVPADGVVLTFTD